MLLGLFDKGAGGIDDLQLLLHGFVDLPAATPWERMMMVPLSMLSRF